MILCGIVLNALEFVVCIKNKTLLRKSTFKLLAIGAINDMLMCFTWNFDDFTQTFFNFSAYSKSLFYCRFMENFLQYITITFASWLLVSISLDRVLRLNIKKWSTHYFSGTRPYIYSFCLALLIISINLVSVLNTGNIFQNGTQIEVLCFEDISGSTAT